MYYKPHNLLANIDINLIFSFSTKKLHVTRKHSSRMRTDRTITKPNSERLVMRLIVDRQTPVKTLPSLAVGNNRVLELTELFVPSVRLECVTFIR